MVGRLPKRNENGIRNPSQIVSQTLPKRSPNLLNSLSGGTPPEPILCKRLPEDLSRTTPSLPSKVAKQTPKGSQIRSQIVPKSDKNRVKNRTNKWDNCWYDFAATFDPTCSIWGWVLEAFWRQNCSANRNTHFSKNALAPRREHNKSRFDHRCLREIRIKIASEKHCKFISLREAIFAVRNDNLLKPESSNEL